MPKLNKRFIDRLSDTEEDRYVWDSELKGFGVVMRPPSKVHTSGSKTFVVRYRTAAGRDRRMVLGRFGVLTPTEARNLAIEALAEARAGGDPMARRQGLKRAPLVADLAERYVSDHLPTKKPTSQEHDRIALRVHILPHLGAKRLDDVAEQDIARLHRGMCGTPVMANRVLALLRNMFGLAHRWGMIEGVNPCEHVKRYREEPRNRFLSDEELGRLGKALAEIDYERGANRTAIAAIRLLALTGARRNEVLHLRWEDIDTQRRIAWLRDSKTGARPLRLEDPALDLLASLPRRKCEWVFPSKRKPNSPLSNIAKTWANVLRRAGIGELRLHDLRHTKASVGAEMGLSLQVIGAMLGHARASTTERYAHLTADPVRAAEERVQGHIAEALNGSQQ